MVSFGATGAPTAPTTADRRKFWRGDASWAYPGMACKVRQATAQSILASTDTKITWPGTSDINSGSLYTVTAAGITVPVAGVYLLTGRVFYAANATGTRCCGFWINSTYQQISQNFQPSFGSSYQTLVQSGSPFSLAAGDVVTLNAWQDSGGALNTYVGAPYYTELDIMFVGPS